MAWASLASQILIVVTGGIVRLTGSGLGCPTWPKCTEESLITVPEMGIHGVIEFANRLLTFVLAIIALGTLISVIKTAQRVGLRWPAWLLLIGIPAQAVLGGFTVLTKLNPWFVGAHFVLSAIMIWLASLLLWRVYKPAMPAVPYISFRLATPLLVTGWVTVLIGVLVTGAGPHSGDAESERNGLDLEIWQHYHSYPGYLMLMLNLLIAFPMFRRAGLNLRTWPLPTRIHGLLLLVTVAQILIGIAQSRLGVPPVLVALHMLGASVLVSLLSLQWLSIRSKPRV